MSYFGPHNHTDASNFRLRDSINKVESLIDYAFECGLDGIAITDHEALSNHVRAFKYAEKNKERLGDFKVAFGNEIYLVDETETEVARGNNEKISFHHFILIAKNGHGYEALKKLSSQAWKNSFYFKGIERVPTYKSYLEEIMKEYKGDIIATSACVGGEIPQLLIEFHNNQTPENKQKVHTLIQWLQNLFGEDLYLELQPSHNEEQLIANEMLLKLGEAYGIKCIVSTDAHYLNKQQAKAHEMYLNAAQGDREVAEFYATTYVMSENELLEFFDSEILNVLMNNTLEIKSKIEPFIFAQEIKVPKAVIPEYKMNQLLVPYYNQYEYIKKYSESQYDVDRYYLHLIANGLEEKHEALNEENLSRINTELDELYHVSENLQQPMSSYFVLTKGIIDLMWQVSLVGVSRGSASCYYVNYLLDIVQINPLKYGLPHWRFLSKERPTMPDIDIDTEGARRQDIIQLVKQHYGEDNILNMGTLTTEGSRSTVLTACRGFGIDNDISSNITDLIPGDKSGYLSIKECIEGNEERKPVTAFINEVEKYPGLKETMLEIEGLISGRGQHASGVIIFPNGYIAQNAMMKTTSGLPVTQFEAPDSEYMGGLKYDFLSINALDRIRAAIELLLEYKKIEWQGSLRATYDKYFHPDVLEFDAPKMYDLLFEGHVLNAFQFETIVGQQALRKIKPSSFDELCAGNSLMRLSSDGEQPLDKFVRFKNNINLWYQEMDEEGLNEEEQLVLKELLTDRYGICDTQEGLMILAMEPKIAGFNLTQANKFRKAVAKQNQKLIEDQKEVFYRQGLERGTRKQFLDYVWFKQFAPQFGYSFSLPHIAGYTLILMIEMNICYRFGVIWWKTACLSCNSGLIGDSTDGGTNYGAIAKAIGDMKDSVYAPDINLSNLGFTPLPDEDKILFGLKPISGLGVDVINTIIENRPYKNFDDFFEKVVATNKASSGKVVTLIKAGCFDKSNPDRRQLMIDFVRRITPKREKLTMAQLPAIIHLADKEKLKKELEVYEFRMKIQGRNKVPMNNEIEQEFIKKYSKNVAYTFENGKLIIDDKSFNKFYNQSTLALRDWVNSPEAAAQFNKLKMQEFWKANCMGTIEAWEMETIMFYTDKHELDLMPIENFFKLERFSELPEIPRIVEWKNYRGRRIPRFQISVIAGTVIDKIKGKGLVYILAQDGLVTVRYNKGVFAHYDQKVVRISDDKKEVLDDSWFSRGQKLVIVGYRRGDEFVAKTTGSLYNHTTYRIVGYDKEKVYMQTEKAEA